MNKKITFSKKIIGLATASLALGSIPLTTICSSCSKQKDPDKPDPGKIDPWDNENLISNIVTQNDLQLGYGNMVYTTFEIYDETGTNNKELELETNAGLQINRLTGVIYGTIPSTFNDPTTTYTIQVETFYNKKHVNFSQKFRLVNKGSSVSLKSNNISTTSNADTLKIKDGVVQDIEFTPGTEKVGIKTPALYDKIVNAADNQPVLTPTLYYLAGTDEDVIKQTNALFADQSKYSDNKLKYDLVAFIVQEARKGDEWQVEFEKFEVKRDSSEINFSLKITAPHASGKQGRVIYYKTCANKDKKEWGFTKFSCSSSIIRPTIIWTTDLLAAYVEGSEENIDFVERYPLISSFAATNNIDESF